MSFSYKEIFQALKDIIEDKSPSSKNFTTKLFSHIWNLIGKQFLAVMHHFYHTHKVHDIFKNTLINLITKTKHATTLVEYHPISLYNTFYKAIVKILANKIKKTFYLRLLTLLNQHLLEVEI